MSSDGSLVDERLSVFDDEPDLNDWFEVICGSLMAVIGIFQLISPGELVDPDVMRWFAAAVSVSGLLWAAHGLKDMAIKEVRKVKGPSLIEFVVDQHDMVYPMVPAGANLDAMIRRPESKKDEIDEKSIKLEKQS